MQLNQRPYNYLLLTSFLLFVIGLFNFNDALVVDSYGTYFVFKLAYYIWIPAVILLFFWLIYIVIKKNLYSKGLTWIHVSFTIAGGIYILTYPYLLTNFYEGLGGIPRRYFDIGQAKTYQFSGTLTNTAVAMAIILAFGQITFFLNFFIGLSKKHGRENSC